MSSKLCVRANDLGVEVLEVFDEPLEDLESGKLEELSNSKIEYFLARIYSDNEPSLRLFQKLGVTFIGKEPSEYQTFLKKLKEV